MSLQDFLMVLYFAVVTAALGYGFLEASEADRDFMMHMMEGE